MLYKRFVPLYLLSCCTFFGVAQQSGNYKPEFVKAKVWKRGADGKVKIADWADFETRLISNFSDFQPTPQNGLNKYGSDPSQKSNGTGFFRTLKQNGRWWIIDPEGHYNMHIAVNSLNTGASKRNQQAFAKKFGNKNNWIDKTAVLLYNNGFNGSGSWSDTESIIQNNHKTKKPLIYTLNLNFMAAYGDKRGGTYQVPGHKAYPNNTIFVFDPAFETFCNEAAKKLSTYKDDPNLLGYFSDNEMPLNLKNLEGYLSLKNTKDPGYLAAKAWMKKKGITTGQLTDQHREEFLAVVADKYFSVVTRAIKKYDLNHLYLGCRFYASEKNIPDFMKTAGKYLDIVTINYYGTWTPDKVQMQNWASWTGKPFIITEFYTKAEDSGLPNTSGAGWIVKTQADRGKAYQNFCMALLESKHCVGWHWFKYQDNDPTLEGAEPSNIDANKGIVNHAYQEYAPMLGLMKQLNLNKYQLIKYLDAANNPGRTSHTINTGWKFHQGSLNYPQQLADTAIWEQVAIPHSWNKYDVNDDQPGYYRGDGWYTRTLVLPDSWKNKEIYLDFEGANQQTTVYLNGKKIASHTGGYTGFHVNISKYADFNSGSNELSVKVNNAFNADVPPLSADFTFFGGLYRDVHLTALEKIHFSMDDHGSKGIFVSTPEVTAAKASVKLRGSISNHSGKAEKLLINCTLNYKGKLIAIQNKTVTAGLETTFEINLPEISRPELWSPDSPSLYTVTTTIKHASDGVVLDQLTTPLGFRWFKFDADKGFFLNGKALKLIGASRHQDYKDMANAVPDQLAVRDVELLKEMGGNFLRVAHYPQDQSVLEACNRLGILCSVEIPVVNAITESEGFAANSKTMQLEMIKQNFNHPSVIIWAYMNEVLLRLPSFGNDTLRREVYLNNVAGLARQLEALTRKTDPSRYTMIPNHGNFNLYHRVGLTKIPMLVGWNLYQGWYSGRLQGFADFLDMHHKLLPEKPVLVTEYGADADSRINSNQPVRFDKSIEYAVNYHRFYLKAMLDRPFVAAGIAWNLADFSSEERMETDPHINNKGLLTIGRKPKDTYYFYQARLLKQPFLKIGMGSREVISGIANAGNTLPQAVRVYSNQAQVALVLNGKNIGTKPTSDGMASFTVVFKAGLNVLQATANANGQVLTDQYTVQAKLIPQQLNSTDLPFESLNVSMGDTRFFTEELSGQVWLPEQPYVKGSWGYTGGTRFAMTDTARLSFGSNKAISGSTLDAVYQTQRIGIENFKADVLPGEYEVTFHFAELQSVGQQQALAYDLGPTTAIKEEFEGRSFDVQLNGHTIMQSIGSNLQTARAFSFKTPVHVTGNNGIVIDFIPVKGASILNGIQIRRIY